MARAHDFGGNRMHHPIHVHRNNLGSRGQGLRGERQRDHRNYADSQSTHTIHYSRHVVVNLTMVIKLIQSFNGSRTLLSVRIMSELTVWENRTITWLESINPRTIWLCPLGPVAAPQAGRHRTSEDSAPPADDPEPASCRNATPRACSSYCPLHLLVTTRSLAWLTLTGKRAAARADPPKKTGLRAERELHARAAGATA